MALIETWIVKNNSYSPISILDIMVSYTVAPEESKDLISIGNTAESIANSPTIRNANLLIVGSGPNAGKRYLDSDYTHLHDDYSETDHTHDGLDVLTGGTESDADLLHTHSGLTSVLDVNTLISDAIVNIDLSDFVEKAGSINQLSDITSTGTVIEDAVSKAHDAAHTLLEHTDTAIVTTAKLTLLMDGSNADCCHIHSFQVHNNLTGLDGGTTDQYYHLTLSQHDTLTDGSNADALHTHAGGGGTFDGVHNDLDQLQGGDISNDEMYHLTFDQTDIVSRLGEDSAGLTFDGESIGTGGGSGGTSIHNDLFGLQGGDVDLDEFYHLDFNEFNLLTNGMVADSLHTHDHNLLRGIQGGNASNDDVFHLTSNQVDDVDVIPLLLPAEPTDFPQEPMTVSSSGSSPRVCSGAIPDNTSTGSLGSPTDPVTRRTSSTVTTNTIADSGPGNSGTITAFVNNAADGDVTFDTNDNSQTDLALIISNNIDDPAATPGFWMKFDARINKTGMSTGWNRFKMTHDGAGTTGDVYFIYDNLNAEPETSGGAVTQNSASNTSYSSSILHYGTGTVLNVNTITMTNLSGYTYYGGSDIININDNGNGIVGGSENKTWAQLGETTPIAINQGATLFDNQTVTLDGSTIHTVDNIAYRGRNVSQTESPVSVVSSPNILYINGTQNQHSASFIDEDNIFVDSDLGTSPISTNAQRIPTGSGDTPADNWTATTTTWDPDDTPGLASHDAAVVGGVCSRNQTNYSSGYLPVGADLSGQDPTQYIAFHLRREPLSQFDIQLTAPAGIAGCWVELAGISNTYATTNGWWDMTLVYQGTGIPGTQGGANGNNGCADGTAIPTGTTITNQRYTCIFGTGISSATATNNNIVIRFKLTSGQSITALSFRKV
jgi:hypothetical protein